MYGKQIFVIYVLSAIAMNCDVGDKADTKSNVSQSQKTCYKLDKNNKVECLYYSCKPMNGYDRVMVTDRARDGSCPPSDVMEQTFKGKW